MLEMECYFKLFFVLSLPLQVFAQARKPGIYKEDYLVDLFSRYGMEGESPPPPALPAWCKEYDDDDDDDGDQQRENGPSKQQY